jgi:hypothetical protein
VGRVNPSSLSPRRRFLSRWNDVKVGVDMRCAWGRVEHEY